MKQHSMQYFGINSLYCNVVDEDTADFTNLGSVLADAPSISILKPMSMEDFIKMKNKVEEWKEKNVYKHCVVCKRPNQHGKIQTPFVNCCSYDCFVEFNRWGK